MDPLTGDMPQWSPYSYTFDNPIRYIDPDGRSPDDWVDKNGKKMTESQLKDVQVYIFYDPSDDGFSDQTMKQYEHYTKKYGEGSVALSSETTEAGFAQDWKDISGSPKLINVNHHGTNQALHLDSDTGQYIVSTGTGKINKSGTDATNVSNLPKTNGDLSNTLMCLNTCNSNNPNQIPIKSGTTLAKGFSNTEVGTVRGSNKSVNFDDDGMPTPQWYYGGVWQYFKGGKQFQKSKPKSLSPYPVGPKY